MEDSITTYSLEVVQELQDIKLLIFDNLELINLKLNELVTLIHLIFIVALMIIITLVIYSVFKKFFY